MIISYSVLLRMRNVSDKICRGNQNTHFVFNEVCRLRDNVGTYCRAERRPQMTVWRLRILCWITKATQKQTNVICNTYCCSTATVVSRTHVSVKFYVHCLSCCLLLLWNVRNENFQESTPLTQYFCPSVCSCGPTREQLDGICTEFYV